MNINSYVSQKEMKNLDWFVLLAVAFFFPRLPITKATINFQFPLAIKAEWSSGG